MLLSHHRWEQVTQTEAELRDASQLVSAGITVAAL